MHVVRHVDKRLLVGLSESDFAHCLLPQYASNAQVRRCVCTNDILPEAASYHGLEFKPTIEYRLNRDVHPNLGIFNHGPSDLTRSGR